MKQKGAKSAIHALPFYFSNGFQVLFGVVSLLLIGLYLFEEIGLYVAIAADICLLAAALTDYALAPSSDLITVERRLLYPLAVGKNNEAPLEIINRTGRVLSLSIWDDFPVECVADGLPKAVTAKPGADNRVVYKLNPSTRGNGAFGNIYFWFKGPLGLIWKRGEQTAARTVKMYPGLALIQERKIKLRLASSMDMIRPMRTKGAGSEFDSLREYVPGDDPRLIHWSATARRAKPMVRQNRIERSQAVFLLIDAGRMMTARVMGKTKFDYGVDALLMLAYGALEMGDRVGAMTVGQEVLSFLPPAKGPGHFGRILDSVYALEPKMEEPRYYLALSGISSKLRRRSLIVIFTDLIDERASTGLVRCSIGLLPRHLPLVVVMADTEVTNLSDNTSPASKQDFYRQAVACEMLERREKLLAKLRSMGVMILDAAPDKISGLALDRYLEIKARNLL